ncbi:MAG: DUF6057 family protein [Marinifilaceae bacterium]
MLQVRNKISIVAYIIVTIIVFYGYTTYYHNQSVFQASMINFQHHSNFFIELLKYPGGMANYISLFFVQYFDVSGVAGIILALMSIILYTVLRGILRNFDCGNGFLPRLVSIVTVCAFLTQHSYYDYMLSQSVHVLFFYLGIYAVSFIRTNSNRLSILLLLFPAFITLLSGGMLILWYTLVMILLSKGQVTKPIIIAIGILLLMFGGSAWLWVNYFFIDYTHIWRFWSVPFEKTTNIWSLLLFAPMIILLLLPRMRSIVSSKWTTIIELSAYASMFVLMYSLNYYSNADVFIGLINETRNENWDKVIELSKQYNGNRSEVTQLTNLALNKKGVLGDSLFTCPQKGLEGLFYNVSSNYFNRIINHEIFYQLGVYNEALHWASEALGTTLSKKSIYLQKRIATALIHLNKPEAARKYLYAIYYNNGQKEWVKERLKSLKKFDDSSPSLQSFVSEDFQICSFGPMYDLVELSRIYPHNVMIRDYLLCAFLLEGKIRDFYSFLNIYFPPYREEPIPSIYDQALIIVERSGIDKLAMDKYVINKEIRSQYKQYGFSYNNQNVKENLAWLNENYGNTLWYYYHFNDVK